MLSFFVRHYELAFLIKLLFNENGLHLYIFMLKCKPYGRHKMEFGKRIELARKANGLSMRSLAEKIGLSAMAISKYERGLIRPSSGVLIQLAEALNVNVEFFFRPAPESVSLVLYRKHASLGKTQLNSINSRIQEWLERYLEIESFLNLNSNINSNNIWQHYPVSSIDEIENIADQVRKDWNLGLDPIDNLIEVMESKGFKIELLECEDGFDACTFRSNGVPVIVVRKGIPGDRQRFNIAHELGHILLNVNQDIEEKAANRFAGAFLFPRSMVLMEFGSHRTNLSLREIELLKHKYGISMQAILHRVRDLNIIHENYYRDLCKYFSQMDYRKQEPGEPLASEQPIRMQQLLLRLLAENTITQSKAEELNGEPIKEWGTIKQIEYQS